MEYEFLAGSLRARVRSFEEIYSSHPSLQPMLEMLVTDTTGVRYEDCSTVVGKLLQCKAMNTILNHYFV